MSSVESLTANFPREQEAVPGSELSYEQLLAALAQRTGVDSAEIGTAIRSIQEAKLNRELSAIENDLALLAEAPKRGLESEHKDLLDVNFGEWTLRATAFRRDGKVIPYYRFVGPSGNDAVTVEDSMSDNFVRAREQAAEILRVHFRFHKINPSDITNQCIVCDAKGLVVNAAAITARIRELAKAQKGAFVGMAKEIYTLRFVPEDERRINQRPAGPATAPA